MLISEKYPIPTEYSLLFIAICLSISIFFSWRTNHKNRGKIAE
jgi:hypothetical protein